MLTRLWTMWNIFSNYLLLAEKIINCPKKSPILRVKCCCVTQQHVGLRWKKTASDSWSNGPTCTNTSSTSCLSKKITNRKSGPLNDAKRIAEVLKAILWKAFQCFESEEFFATIQTSRSRRKLCRKSIAVKKQIDWKKWISEHEQKWFFLIQVWRIVLPKMFSKIVKTSMTLLLRICSLICRPSHPSSETCNICRIRIGMIAGHYHQCQDWHYSSAVFLGASSKNTSV